MVKIAVASHNLVKLEAVRNGFQRMFHNHDFWVGIEGGCDYLDGEMVAFAWVVVLSTEMQGRSRTALFQLPPAVKDLVEGGYELGDADDHVFGKRNSKQNSGTVGLLTGDVVTRTGLYEQGVILALIPFKNELLYQRQ